MTILLFVMNESDAAVNNQQGQGFTFRRSWFLIVVFGYCCCYVLLKTSLTGTALVELLSRRPLDTFGVSLSLSLSFFKNATKSRTVFILSGGSIESILPMYLYIRCIIFLVLPRKPAFTIDKIYTARQFLFKRN